MMMALAATAMVACSNNNDLFDGGAAVEKSAKQTYAENFVGDSFMRLSIFC